LHVCPKQFLYRLKVVLYYKDYLYIYAMYVFSLQQVVGGTAFSIIWLCPFLCLGKQLKGQTQKTQQAILQKFRSGVYNVLVATSIGEEGLDIIEVDLVICFDANVSPLRMIQRMGRTGRKHDGQVDILF